MTHCVLVVALLTGPGDVVPLERGDPAPFDGLLVPEGRFVELLEAENKARELEVRLALAERTGEAIEGLYRRRLEEATAIPWYDSPTFNRWLGVVLGGALAGVAVWTAAEIQTQTR